MDKIYTINKKLLKITALSAIILFTVLFIVYWFEFFFAFAKPLFAGQLAADKKLEFIFYTATSVLNEAAAIYLLGTMFEVYDNKKSGKSVVMSGMIFLFSALYYFTLILKGQFVYIIFFVLFLGFAIATLLCVQSDFDKLSDNENIIYRRLKWSALVMMSFVVIDLVAFFTYLIYFMPKTDSGVFSIQEYVNNIANTSNVFLFLLVVCLLWASLFFNLFYGLDLFKKCDFYAQKKEFEKHKQYLKIIAGITIFTVPVLIPVIFILKAIKQSEVPNFVYIEDNPLPKQLENKITEFTNDQFFK